MKTWILAAGLAVACLPSIAPVHAAAAPSSVAASGAADDAADVYKKLVAERAEAVVSIKYVMKEEDQEQEEEVTGFMIEESGMIITSNWLMGGFPEVYKQMTGGRNRTPKDIKVLIGDDNEGIEAKLIARDSERDLAWLQISKPEGKKFKFVDLSKSVAADVGDRLLTLERLGKTYDRQPIVNESRVRTVVSKPRKLIVPGTAHAQSLGQAMFNGKGEFVGVPVLQLPNKEEMQAEQGSMFSQMRSIRGAMVLPAEDVVKATSQAKEFAKSGKSVDPEPEAKPEDAPAPAGPDAEKKPEEKK